MEKVLHGEAFERGLLLPVEFLGEAPGDTRPDDNAVIFVVDKGGAEKGRYRSVNLSGLWVERPAGLAMRPLVEDTQDDGPEADTPQPQGWATFLTELRDDLSALD